MGNRLFRILQGEKDEPAVVISGAGNAIPQAVIAELLESLLADNVVRDRKVVELLQSSNPNRTLNNLGLKPIHVAVENKNVPLLKDLLKNSATDVNALSSGFSALHLAASLPSLEMVQIILDHPKVNVNHQGGAEKRTALMMALAADFSSTDKDIEKEEKIRCELVELLINDERCQIDMVDSDGWTALTYAARQGLSSIADMLLRNGRTQLYTIDQLINAANLAYTSGHENICEQIIENLTVSQKIVVQERLETVRKSASTTPLLREMLRKIHQDMVDSGYIEIPIGQAWDSVDKPLRISSVVRVSDDKTLVQTLQRDVGKWRDSAVDCLGKRGRVTGIDVLGVLTVDFSPYDSKLERLRCINPKLVEKLSNDNFQGRDVNDDIVVVDDCVTLIEDNKLLENLQNDDVETVSHAKKNLGKPGTLKYFLDDESSMVMVAGKDLVLKPAVIRKVQSVTCTNGSVLEVGDTVKLSALKPVVQRFQTAQYGGWVDKLDNLLGKTGLITAIACDSRIPDVTPDLYIRVRFDKDDVNLNPNAVTMIAKNQKPAKPIANPQRPVDPVPGINEELDKRPRPVPLPRNPPSLNLLREDIKPSPTPIPPTPDIINDFVREIPFNQLKFEEKIGKGGFATVFAAKWRNAKCAVKVVRMNMDTSESSETPEIDGKMMLLEEIKFHSQLAHPHIVQFLGVSFNENDPLQLNAYIVMRYVAGYNLHEVIFKKKMNFTHEGRLSLSLALQICDAISYIHDDAKLVHQDIKPHNILVDEATKQALVTDFGISSTKPNLEASIAMYTTDARGSAPYMAPELLEVRSNGLYRKPSNLSDIWSLGATLTELFTGSHLYGNNHPDLATLIKLKLSPKPPIALEEANTKYKSFLESAMRSDPASRPSAAALGKDLVSSGVEFPKTLRTDTDV